MWHLFFRYGLMILVCAQSLWAAIPFEASDVGDVSDFLGHKKCKVVFAVPNNGIQFIDYSDVTSGSPSITKMQNVPNEAILPVISDDGEWITYVTNLSGEDKKSGASKVWLCPFEESGEPVHVTDNGYTPRFVRNTENPTILYSTWEGTRTEDWPFGGHTMKVEYSNGSFQTPDTVWAEGSFIGGLSVDHRWLCVAPWGQNVFFVDLENANSDDDVIEAFNFDWATQTCNGSISSSSIYTNSMIFLDYRSGAANPYGTWGFHDMIFFIDSDNNILGNYYIPSDMYPAVTTDEIIAGVAGEIEQIEWDHVEYTNHPLYAVSGVKVERIWSMRFSSDGVPPTRQTNVEGLFLINLKDSAYQKVLTKTSELDSSSTMSAAYPYAWIDTSGFTEDSEWLDGNNVQTSFSAQRGVGQPIVVSGTMIYAYEPVSSVRLYSPDGRHIASQRFRNPKTSVRMPGKGVQSSGMYLLQVRMEDGSHSTVPCVIE